MRIRFPTISSILGGVLGGAAASSSDPVAGLLGGLIPGVLGNRPRSFDQATLLGVNDEQIARRAPQVDALSNFYRMAYGTDLSERGRMEADYFVRTGRLQNDGMGGEFDNQIDFERAFGFLVQQREDALMRSQERTMMGAGMQDRVSSRVNLYSGSSAFGV